MSLRLHGSHRRAAWSHTAPFTPRPSPEEGCPLEEGGLSGSREVPPWVRQCPHPMPAGLGRARPPTREPGAGGGGGAPGSTLHSECPRRPGLPEPARGEGVRCGQRCVSGPQAPSQLLRVAATSPGAQPAGDVQVTFPSPFAWLWGRVTEVQPRGCGRRRGAHKDAAPCPHPSRKAQLKRVKDVTGARGPTIRSANPSWKKCCTPPC